ncbi:MAG: NAD-dependent epimerase/dehydratase family protein [Brumimicrobium sp.]|nr:NAD-dependent epimerase/dehydratase family protein [Brumimicrobium sp.]
MKIAITGASGHIGSVLCRELIQEGYEVVALVRNSNLSLEGLPIQFCNGNVLDKNSLKCLMEGCDAIFHVAGVIGLGYRFHQRVYDINVTGTQNILQVAKELGIQKVVHFSSIHVFKQFPYNIPLDETRKYIEEKAIFYDKTKRDGHELAIQASKDGQDVVIVCPTGVIGPFDFQPSKLGKATIDIYRGKFPAMIKGGFDFVDVRDVARGAIQAMKYGKSGEAYILGGRFYPLKEFAELVYKVKGKTKRFIELPVAFAIIGLPFIQLYALLTRTKPIYDKVYLDILVDGNQHISTEKAEKELGYTKTSMEQTLTDTFEWFKSRGTI